MLRHKLAAKILKVYLKSHKMDRLFVIQLHNIELINNPTLNTLIVTAISWSRAFDQAV